MSQTTLMCNRDLSAREERSRFFAAHGIPPDGGYASTWWSCQFGRITVRIYNFSWRRRAIGLHDLHHILTGYECTLPGEIQMATWEFAAGPFPHYGARLFCLPLIVLGALFLPRKSLAAYVLGRGSTSLYSLSESLELLDLPMETLRSRILPTIRPETTPADRVAYGYLVARAIAVLGIPLVGLFALYI